MRRKVNHAFVSFLTHIFFFADCLSFMVSVPKMCFILSVT